MGKLEKSIIEAEKYCENAKTDLSDKADELVYNCMNDIEKEITCSLGNIDDRLRAKINDKILNLHVDLRNVFIRKAEEIKDKIFDISDNIDGISNTEPHTTWADVFNPRERRIPKDE